MNGNNGNVKSHSAAISLHVTSSTYGVARHAVYGLVMGDLPNRKRLNSIDSIQFDSIRCSRVTEPWPSSYRLEGRDSAMVDVTTGALRVNKCESAATAIIARWPQVSHTAFSYSTYSRRWVFRCDWLGRLG